MNDLGEQGVGARHYSLYALVEHRGSYTKGHYTAYVRDGSGWRCMNDSVVKPVDEAAVCGAEAFLLFYRADK